MDFARDFASQSRAFSSGENKPIFILISFCENPPKNIEIMERGMHQKVQGAGQADLVFALHLVEQALEICDRLGHVYAALDLCAALEKLSVIRDGSAKADV